MNGIEKTATLRVERLFGRGSHAHRECESVPDGCDDALDGSDHNAVDGHDAHARDKAILAGAARVDAGYDDIGTGVAHLETPGIVLGPAGEREPVF